MAIYTLGASAANIPQGAPACEVRSTSQHKPKIMEFGFSQNVAPATTDASVGLGRPATIGLNPGGAVQCLDEQDGQAPVGMTTIATGWGTPPTSPVNFFRRSTISRATIGVGAIWCFPNGLGLPVTSSVVLWVIAVNASVTMDVWCSVEE